MTGTSRRTIVGALVPDAVAPVAVVPGADPVPTLLVWTDHEPSGGIETGERFAAALPDGELLLVRNAAHWPQWEQPETHDAIVTSFLTGPA